MTGPGRQTGSFGDELTNILMAGLIGLFGVTLILRAADLSPRSSPGPRHRRPGSPVVSVCSQTPATRAQRSVPKG